MLNIDAKGKDFRLLNEEIRSNLSTGAQSLKLDNVNGQRFICCGINKPITMEINGVPGNDLGAFMDGPSVRVMSNSQDCVGNTMNGGKIIVHGNAGDVAGYAMRGGRIFVKGNVGYRVGINMKSFMDNIPVIVVGGVAGDFLGEYMAGGIIILLNLNDEKICAGDYLGTGMHGGTMYIRGNVNDAQLGKEVGKSEMSEEDNKILGEYLADYCKEFNLDLKKILKSEFVKLIPKSHRPYGNLYCH